MYLFVIRAPISHFFVCLLDSILGYPVFISVISCSQLDVTMSPKQQSKIEGRAAFGAFLSNKINALNYRLGFSRGYLH